MALLGAPTAEGLAPCYAMATRLLERSAACYARLENFRVAARAAFLLAQLHHTAGQGKEGVAARDAAAELHEDLLRRQAIVEARLGGEGISV
jgi:anaphase-promoting complex subunit 5